MMDWTDEIERMKDCDDTGFLCETCSKCGKPVSFHRYFIHEDKVIEVCKECYRKLQVHRTNVKVKGKTIVVD